MEDRPPAVVKLRPLNRTQGGAALRQVPFFDQRSLPLLWVAPIQEAQEHLIFGQLLRGPYEVFLRRIHAELAATGFADTYAAWGTNIFHYLREGGLRLTELAERTHITKQALLYTINQLEAAGYVERVPDPTDGRAKIIRLTQRGWEGRRVADEIMTSLEHECVQRLGEERMQQFKALIKDESCVLEENRVVTI